MRPTRPETALVSVAIFARVHDSCRKAFIDLLAAASRNCYLGDRACRRDWATVRECPGLPSADR